MRTMLSFDFHTHWRLFLIPISVRVRSAFPRDIRSPLFGQQVNRKSHWIEKKRKKRCDVVHRVRRIQIVIRDGSAWKVTKCNFDRTNKMIPYIPNSHIYTIRGNSSVSGRGYWSYFIEKSKRRTPLIRIWIWIPKQRAKSHMRRSLERKC